MRSTDAMLDHKWSLDFYRSTGLLRDDSPDADHWRVKAWEMHYYHVHDALLELKLSIPALVSTIPAGAAVDHLQYGIGRRLRFVWDGIRELNDTAPPSRTRPMNLDEGHRASRALNDIYIHTLGTLDNYSHALGWLSAGKAFARLRPMQRSLFNERFLAVCQTEPIGSLSAAFAEWEAGVKKLRHPVAHGIPLTVPPSVLTPSDQPDYNVAMAAYQAEFNSPPSPEGADRGDAYEAWGKRVEEKLARVQSVGTFVPLISHDPRAGAQSIYPTVLDDVGKLVQFGRAANKVLADLTGRTSNADEAEATPSAQPARPSADLQ